MGVIRGIFLVLTVVLLFLSFFVMNTLWTLSLSLNYDTLQKESIPVIKESLQDTNVTQIIGQNYALIQLYCQNNTEFVFQAEGFTFDIPCETALQGQDALVEEGFKDILHSIYYTKYDCSFLDCFAQSPIPLFLISEGTYNLITDKFYLCLIVAGVLSVLIFLLTEKRTNTPLLIGIVLILSSIPFFKLDYLFSLFSDKIVFKFLGIFFSQAYTVSVKTLIVGIILVIAGIVLKIFKVGFHISNFINKIKGKETKKPESKETKKEDKKQKPSRSKSK